MDAAVVVRQARIKEIVCDILELEPHEVTETSHFTDDHGADSLRALEILAGLEREFDIAIDQSALPRMGNLRSVYDVVAELAAP